MSATLRWTWPIRVPGSIGATVALRSSARSSCCIYGSLTCRMIWGSAGGVHRAGLTRASLPPTNAGKPRDSRGCLMADAGLAKTIDDAFERRNDVGPATRGPVRQAVEAALDLLDRGEARVAEKQADNSWRGKHGVKQDGVVEFRPQHKRAALTGHAQRPRSGPRALQRI